MPEILKPESQELANDQEAISVDIEFVFCNHSPENLIKIADTLIASEGDIIAIEKIREGTFGMGTADDKVALGEKMTRFISPDNDDTETASRYFSTDDLLFTRLLDGLRGSGKKIVLIDMGTDDKNYNLYQESIRARERYNDAIEKGNTSDELIADLKLDTQISAARSDEYREWVMGRQIKGLAETNPGSKITVMMGLIHTPVSFNANGFSNAKRTFITDDTENPQSSSRHKVIFDQDANYRRMLRLRLGEMGLSTIPNADSDK